MKIIILKTIFFLIALAIFFYAGSIMTAKNTLLYEFQGRNWYLAEVKSNTAIIKIDRIKAPTNIYSIRFEAERFIGIGAPNRLFGLYTVNKGHSIFLQSIRSTRINPIYEMRSFNEQEYLAYLKKVNRWEIQKEKLHLYSSNEDGEQIILIFSF
jgi:heat shock protein HslJ